LVFEPLPSLHAVVFSYAQARESLTILPNLEPEFVALYDPDAAFVRTLEAYQAGRPLDRPSPRGVLHAVRAERGGAEESDVTGQGDEGLQEPHRGEGSHDRSCQNHCEREL
ncbi:unnamed protein product, partial [Ectocarpus fasciculatus]